MRRGTTPTINVTVPSDISLMSIHLAFKVGRTLIEKKGADLTVTTETDAKGNVSTHVSCKLSQADTLSMAAGQNCEVQIRAIDDGGLTALATTIASLPVERILQDGELDG